jgi:UDP-glucose 4-epimerase
VRKVLITGIAGARGRLLTKRIHRRWQVLGVDREGWEGAPENVAVHRLDIRKTRFEDILRREKPDAVVHLAFVRHFRGDLAVRHQVNVAGTRRLLEVCAEVGVGQLIAVSSHYVYGALPDNPRYVDEEHPLNASRTFPEIRDLCEVEGLLSTYLWRYPEVATAILRPVNTLGPWGHSAIGGYLKMPMVPTVAGFDPMMQFLHEEDLAKAIELALDRGIRGVFNVAGPGAVPLSAAIRAVGATPLPVPGLVASPLLQQLFRFNVSRFPPGALDYLKYPCTISDEKFRAATGFRPDNPLSEIFNDLPR